MKFINELKEGERIESVFAVTDKQMRTTTKGKPFISMRLSDKTGAVPGVAWDNAEALSARFERGDIVEVRAEVGSYQGGPQLVVQNIRRVDPGEHAGRFLPQAEKDVDKMASELVSIVGTAVSIAGSLVLPTLEGFILTELIWGFFFGMLVLIGGPFMTENSAPAQRDLLFSVQFALSMLAFMFGNFFGGRLVTLLAGLANIGNEAPGAYAGALWVSVALMVASMLPFLFLEKHLGESRPRRVSPARASRSSALVINTGTTP